MQSKPCYCFRWCSHFTITRFRLHFAKEINKNLKTKRKLQYIIADHFNITNDLWDQISKTYNGGMTFVNPKIKEKIINKVVQYDVNSMYPAIMMQEKLPYGKPVELTKTNFLNKDKYFKFYKVILLKPIRIKDGFIPWIPFKNKDNIAEHLEYIDGNAARNLYLTEPSYNDFLKDYDVSEDANIETVITHMFKKKIMFASYMENWETIKAKGGFYKTFAKLMMNGLYGKWAQKRRMEGRKLTPFVDVVLSISKADASNKARFGGYILDKQMSETKYPYYIPIASAITGYARSKLTRGIQANKERFLYCDTDSIHLQGHQTAEGINIHSSKFGDWSIEWKAKRGIYVRAKRYMVEKQDGTNKITLAGFNNYRPKSLEQFQSDCINGKKILEATQGRKKVKGGVIILMKTKTLKGNNINELVEISDTDFEGV